MVMIKDNQWTGFDNFLNISRSFAVQVNLIKGEKVELDITTEELRQKITSVFQSDGLQINENGQEGKPPLPYYNMLVMIFPVRDGYTAACVARLFEEVSLERLRLQYGETYQAITWTQANLIVASTEEFKKLLISTVEGMASTFTKRVTSQHLPEKPPEPERLSPEELQER
jgi:hypothetical protein